jgi:hypothetical protein
MVDNGPQRRITDEWLVEQLEKLLVHGARAEWLIQDAPDLVNLLCSAESHPDLSDRERADAAEQVIRKAIDFVDRDYFGPAGSALLCLFGLGDDPMLQDAPLRIRTECAARTHRIQPRTFRRGYRDLYIEELADAVRERRS